MTIEKLKRVTSGVIQGMGLMVLPFAYLHSLSIDLNLNFLNYSYLNQLIFLNKIFIDKRDYLWCIVGIKEFYTIIKSYASIYKSNGRLR